MPARASDRPLRVNLVAWDHGGGLTTDTEVLSRLLTNLGCHVRFNGHVIRYRPGRAQRAFHAVRVRLRHGYASIGAGPVYDVNFFIERIVPRFVPYARRNCFLPNPEWFRQENMRYLSQMDWVLCKTWDAVEIFKPLVSDARYLGFTSLDKLAGGRQLTDQLLCLHAAGGSRWKGTSAVVQAWRRHPEWPRLILIQNRCSYGGDPMEKHPEAPNIDYVIERLDDKTWRNCQNRCAVHVCPSEAEGFGHILMEGMSCGAVVITTDGPPMNEVVTNDRGVLVRPKRSEPMRLGTAYYVDVDDLERQIERVFKMKPEERQRLGNNARTWYEAQSGAFEKKMKQFVDEIRCAEVPARLTSEAR